MRALTIGFGALVAVLVTASARADSLTFDDTVEGSVFVTVTPDPTQPLHNLPFFFASVGETAGPLTFNTLAELFPGQAPGTTLSVAMLDVPGGPISDLIDFNFTGVINTAFGPLFG